jgi:dihydroneopterin aldolase / 2-amino-4-hydroxy-6-hydroxymethyldihydropteridine diphosphokinase
MIANVYVAFGSNIGDRQAYIDEALKELRSYDEIDVVRVADSINTKAVTNSIQPDYLNSAAHLTTIFSLREFFEVCLLIEQKLGRKSKHNHDPRTIDIDILFFGNIIASEDDLIIPHPLLHERLFVLRPLVQIAPNLNHPLLNVTVNQLYLEKCEKVLTI